MKLKNDNDLERIRKVVLSFGEGIHLAGAFGSQEEDLDILVVLKEQDWGQYERMCETLREEVPGAIFFPTFRLQEFTTWHKRAGKKQVHLLAYPSPGSFLGNERPFIRYCIVKSLDRWVGPDLLAGGEPRPVPDIAYYVNLLFETGQLYLMKELPDDLVLSEVRKKLLYILKFSVLEAFYEGQPEIDLRNIAATIFKSIPKPHVDEAERLYLSVALWKEPTRGEILAAFQNASEILSKIAKESASRG